jgi:O-antigen ligase
MSLVLVAMISTSVTPDKMHTLYGIVALTKTLVLYLVIANSIRSKSEAISVFNYLLSGLLLAATLYLLMSALHINVNANGQVTYLTAAESLSGNVRPAGTLGHPNAAGGYFAGMLMLALASFGMRQSIPQRITAICAVFLGSAALLMTFTRTAWIAFACGFLCLAAVGIKKKVFGGVFVAAMLCLAPIGMIVFDTIVITRMTTGLSSYESRKPLIKQAFYIIGQHPVWGIGANAYNDVLRDYVPEDMGKNVWLYSVHNAYLYQWVEMGTVGLLAFLWLLLALGREARRLLNVEDHSIRAIALGAISFLLTEAVFMNGVQWYVFHSSGLSFCMLLALTAFLNIREDASTVHTHENKGLLASAIKAERPAIA